jgi:DNA-binding transcriptional MerR regulator
MIQRLTQEEGMNLAGVRMMLEMESELERMRRRAERLAAELARQRERVRAELERMEQRNPPSAMVPLYATRRIRLRVTGTAARDDRQAIELGPGEDSGPRTTSVKE